MDEIEYRIARDTMAHCDRAESCRRLFLMHHTWFDAEAWEWCCCHTCEHGGEDVADR